ncbi:MAG: cyclic nucleotide-binding domain-containing protein [Terriglobales bacterium]
MTRTLLIVSQVFALITFIFALEFLQRTTGGTLFLFSTVGFFLALLAAAIVFGFTIYHYLKRHSLFAMQDIGPGQEILCEGEEGDCAYFIHSGEVEVVRRESGAEKVVARLSKGEYFGEMALISNAPHNATVRSVTPLRVAILGKENFLTMLRLMPHTEEDIMKVVHARAMETGKR